MESLSGLIPFFIILSAGLFFSDFFRRVHLPYVSALIIAGIVVGPFGLDIVELSETVNFLGGIGLIFLMFIAGSEVQIKSFKRVDSNILILAFVNGLMPFLVGAVVGRIIELPVLDSILLGVTFISTSIAVVVPAIESQGLLKTTVGRLVLPATILEDISSLLILAVILRSRAEDAFLPWPLFILLTLIFIIFLKYSIPFIENHFIQKKSVTEDLFERELRFTVAILIGSTIVFELLGLSPIVAGFIIGIFLKDYIKKDTIENKLRTISYGIFIPSFFLSVGMQLDFDAITQSESLLPTILIVTGLIGSKFLSSIISAKSLNLSYREGFLIGSLTIPQLSTTLATAFAAREVGLLNDQVVASLIILSLITVFVAPILVSYFGSNIAKEEDKVDITSPKKEIVQSIDTGSDFIKIKRVGE